MPKFVIRDLRFKGCYLTDIYLSGSTRWGKDALEFDTFGAAFKALFLLGLGWGWGAAGAGALKLDLGVENFEIIKIEEND